MNISELNAKVKKDVLKVISDSNGKKAEFIRDEVQAVFLDKLERKSLPWDSLREHINIYLLINTSTLNNCAEIHFQMGKIINPLSETPRNSIDAAFKADKKGAVLSQFDTLQKTGKNKEISYFMRQIMDKTEYRDLLPLYNLYTDPQYQK